MSTRLTRRLVAVLLAVVSLVALHVQSAAAMVSPDDPGSLPTTQTLVVSSIDWSRLAIAAAVACLVGVAATLAVLGVLRHTNRPALRHS